MATHPELDLTGLRCPMPIVKLNKLRTQLTPGDEIVASADDPAFSLDVEAWCKRIGCELIEKKEVNGALVVRIRVCA